MNQLMKRIAIFLCVVMVSPIILGCLPSVNSVSVAAAAAAQISNPEVTIGIASTESIYLDNANTKAKYTYSSSNKKVATVDKKGNVTSVAAGTAKITVSQVLNKKTTKIGTQTVTVKEAYITEKKATMGIGSMYMPYMDCMNGKAKYTYTTSDKSIMAMSDDGFFVTKKAGTATITVKQVYNKKTTKIGTVTVTVEPTSINWLSRDIVIQIGSVDDPLNLITLDNQNYSMDADGNTPTYTYTIADTSIANIQEVYDDFWGEYKTGLTGLQLGTTTLTITENFGGASTVVGTVNLTVVEASEW